MPESSKPIWSGSIAIGLVNVPVRLHPAVQNKDVHFNMLRESDSSRVRRKLVAQGEDEEVPKGELVRGYEVTPGQYVVVEEYELEALAPLARQTIRVDACVDLSGVDPIYFERAYYLAPDEGGEKGYKLLLESLRKAGKAAIGTFVMRNKEYLAAIRPLDGVLCLETLYFADEVLDASKLPGTEDVEVSERELSLAQDIVEALSEPFEPKKYRDEHREAVLDLIARKAEGREVVSAPPEVEPGKVVDLVEALEASLSEARRRKHSA
jgi:DNA end-binding protein Ku